MTTQHIAQIWNSLVAGSMPDADCRARPTGSVKPTLGQADHHPGVYVKAHESNRDAVYFYYAASAAWAFREHKLALPDGRDWRSELSYALAARQAKDGSWSNPVELVRENDSLVATGNAVLALARCRE